MKVIKKALKIVGIGFAALIVLVIAIGIFGGGSDSPRETSKQQTENSTTPETKETGGETDYAAMVQTGYLGEFTDASVKDILDMNFGVDGFKLDWICSDMDGKDFVAFYAYRSDETLKDGTTVLFQICSDKTFKVSGYAESGNEDFESAEIAGFLNNWYMNWYVKNKIGADAAEDEVMEKMQELIHDRFDKTAGSAALYGASKDYSGDRGNLCREIDNSEPMDMTVTELINYYGANMIDVYVSGEAGSSGQESTESSDVEAYMDTLYSVEGGDDIVSLYLDDNGKLCVWYGSVSSEEEYYSRAYDSYTLEDDTLCGNAGADTDEFIFMEDGHVDVLLSGYGSSHYQAYMREEAYFNGGGPSAGGNESGSMYISDGDELKNFARDNANIGSTVTFTAEVGENYSQLGSYLLYCYHKDGSFVQIQASAVSGLNLFDGDVVSYTGVFDGFAGGGNQLQFSTVSIELQ